MRINQNAATIILNVKMVTIRVRADAFPAAAPIVRLPLLDLHAVKAAWRLRHRTGQKLRALCFSRDVNKSHGHAPDRHPRCVFQHLIFAKRAEALVKHVNSGADTKQKRAGWIGVTAHGADMLSKLQPFEQAEAWSSAVGRQSSKFAVRRHLTDN